MQSEAQNYERIGMRPEKLLKYDLLSTILTKHRFFWKYLEVPSLWLIWEIGKHKLENLQAEIRRATTAYDRVFPSWR